MAVHPAAAQPGLRRGRPAPGGLSSAPRDTGLGGACRLRSGEPPQPAAAPLFRTLFSSGKLLPRGPLFLGDFFGVSAPSWRLVMCIARRPAPVGGGPPFRASCGSRRGRRRPPCTGRLLPGPRMPHSRHTGPVCRGRGGGATSPCGGHPWRGGARLPDGLVCSEGPRGWTPSPRPLLPSAPAPGGRPAGPSGGTLPPRHCAPRRAGRGSGSGRRSGFPSPVDPATRVKPAGAVGVTWLMDPK